MSSARRLRGNDAPAADTDTDKGTSGDKPHFTDVFGEVVGNSAGKDRQRSDSKQSLKERSKQDAKPSRKTSDGSVALAETTGDASAKNIDTVNLLNLSMGFFGEPGGEVSDDADTQDGASSYTGHSAQDSNDIFAGGQAIPMAGGSLMPLSLPSLSGTPGGARSDLETEAAEKDQSRKSASSEWAKLLDSAMSARPLRPESVAPTPNEVASPLDSPAVVAATSSSGTDSGRTSVLAFEAHLVPMTTSDGPAVVPTQKLQVQAGDPQGPGAPDRPQFAATGSLGKSAVPAAASSAGTANGQQQDNLSSDTQEHKDDATERFRKVEELQPAAGASLTGDKAAVHYAVAPELQENRASGASTRSSDANPVRPGETVEVAAPETPRAPGAVHDIRMEINAGDQKVDVRLVERGGEVHVAVRTADTHLAEALRGDLPTLSSRLTESGFRAEAWRPTVVGGAELHHPAERPAGNSPQQDSNGQPRQNGRQQQPGEQPPPQPKVLEEERHRKEKGKDFEWFMSTHR